MRVHLGPSDFAVEVLTDRVAAERGSRDVLSQALGTSNGCSCRLRIVELMERMEVTKSIGLFVLR